MYKLIKPKFIKSEGYWFNVVQTSDISFEIVNTKRRQTNRDGTTRDGLGYVVKSFNNLENAINFLNSLE